MDFMLLGYQIQIWVCAAITSIAMLRRYRSPHKTPARRTIDITVYFVMNVFAGVFLHQHVADMLPFQVNEVAAVVMTTLSFDTIIASGGHLVKSKSFFAELITFLATRKK